MWRTTAFPLGLALMGAWACSAFGQTSRAGQAAPLPGGGTIRLNLPEEIELKVLVDYVSERLGINILYDEQVGRKRFTVKASADIPKDSLLGLLQSALTMKGLGLVEADQPGWRKIVAVKDLTAVTRRVLGAEAEIPSGEPLDAVTRVIRPKHVGPEAIEQAIKPFLTQPGANTFVIREQSLLVVTDYAFNFPRLLEVIRLADRPGPEVVVRFFPARHLEATTLAADVTRLLSEKRRHARKDAKALDALPTVFAMERTNQVVAVGAEQQMDEVASTLERLDVPLDVVTRVYQFESASPARVEMLARELVDPSILKHRYRSSVDPEAGILIVTAPLSVHETIAGLKRDLDVIAERAASPIRFYRLVNTTAVQVLATIQSLQHGKEGLAGVALPQASEPRESVSKPRAPGPNRPPAAIGEELPKPPAYRESNEGQTPAEAGLKPILRSVQTEEATVTADTNTNTIIVVAPPPVQRVYEELIRLLDKRRPQVLVEAVLVTLDTSGGFSLGVEILHEGSGERHRYLTFSSFGLSTVDTAGGSLALKPGVGFNGALISPDTVDVVIRALRTSGRTRVISAPRILINDNATGTLASIAEAPFTSVNASDTVATTSFAGYASAGTTITVTPHISEGDHLQLSYSVDLSSFGEGGTSSIPPPRQTNSLSSEVTVPSGYAIVVGGLNRKDSSRTVSRVPLLGEIPILEYLFSDRTRTRSESTLFVFLRPIILRDDSFQDLKDISERDLVEAGLGGHYPRGEPLMVD